MTKLKVTLILVGVLAALGTGAAVLAAGKADLSVAASPAHQTVTKGQSVSYTVSVSRANGFSEPVALLATGLPAGTTAAWKLADGTSSNVVPPHLNSATVTLATSASTPGGEATVTIGATGGELTRSTQVALAVEPPTQPGFSLVASPVSRSLIEDDQTTYALSVQRTGGFAGPIALSVEGLPKGASAAWAPSSTLAPGDSTATLTVATDSNPKTGAHDLVVRGVAGSIQRAAPVTLVVDRGQAFRIAGDLAGALAPGTARSLDLALTNPNNFPIQVRSLATSVEERTSHPGCSGSQNFAVTDPPASAYPIAVPANATRTLSQLGVPSSSRPRVAMLNSASDQDACRGASISLHYSGSAGK